MSWAYQKLSVRFAEYLSTIIGREIFLATTSPKVAGVLKGSQKTKRLSFIKLPRHAQPDFHSLQLKNYSLLYKSRVGAGYY